uniref:Molecular chaperone GrpE n=1 Tax=Candidatus Kentrum sp. MB TaxID=2138164 RepID=A0A450XI24_9GAMM|nr:MAG: molecular chaperone GrpE [Candidatus Kentron sp. MB]VFK33413.1 MAG: molecular chaperone GrpE [Candidatus Kentron sp. MB]VFK76155.1 MAG: molecular chaperone GrpE [Candidatus Kentron sp. MB]
MDSADEKENQATGPDPLPQISLLQELLTKGIEQILQQFEAKIKYDARKQEQIDALHAQLQEYKSDLLTKALRPVFNAMIRLHDDAGKTLQALHEKALDELPPERFFKIMEDFLDDIERLLQDHGVESFRDQEPEHPFNGGRQQVAGFVDTPNPDLKGKVAECLRPGFEYGNILLRKEKVKAYRYVAINDIPSNNAFSESEEST